MKKTLILLIVFSLFSCKNNKETPDYVIPFDDMVDIIVEIHITDGLLTSNKIRKQLAIQDSTNFYNTIFENHNYTREDFDTSLYYYSKNINQYDLIYDEVLNKLSEIQSNIIVKREEEIDREIVRE